MYAITYEVTFKGATNTRGARYIVRNTQSDESRTITFDYTSVGGAIAVVIEAFHPTGDLYYSGESGKSHFVTAVIA